MSNYTLRLHPASDDPEDAFGNNLEITRGGTLLQALLINTHTVGSGPWDVGVLKFAPYDDDYRIGHLHESPYPFDFGIEPETPYFGTRLLMFQFHVDAGDFGPATLTLYSDPEDGPVRMVKTNEKGEYTIPYLDDTNFIIKAWADGYASESQRNEDLFTKQEKFEFNFFLQKALTIEGGVVDYNKKPIPGAVIHAISMKEKERQNFTATSDDKGAFVLKGLPNKPFHISATHPLYSSASATKIDAGRDDVWFQLERRSGMTLVVSAFGFSRRRRLPRNRGAITGDPYSSPAVNPAKRCFNSDARTVEIDSGLSLPGGTAPSTVLSLAKRSC